MKNSQDYDMLLIEMLKGIFYLVWLTERQMRAISGYRISLGNLLRINSAKPVKSLLRRFKY